MPLKESHQPGMSRQQVIDNFGELVSGAVFDIAYGGFDPTKDRFNTATQQNAINLDNAEEVLRGTNPKSQDRTIAQQIGFCFLNCPMVELWESGVVVDGPPLPRFLLEAGRITQMERDFTRDGGLPPGERGLGHIVGEMVIAIRHGVHPKEPGKTVAALKAELTDRAKKYYK